MRRAGALLLGAAALVAAAGALASPALFALAVGMVVVTVAAGVSVLLAAHRLTITRSVLQPEAREDKAIGVRFQVQGLGRLLLPLRVEAQVDAGDWILLDNRGGTLELMVGRRGAWELAPSRLRLRDAFGIFEWSVLAGEPEPLLILPAPDLSVPVPSSSGAWNGDGDLDPDGLQPYVPGTPIGRIHWPALARGAGLQQRRLAPPPTGLPLVLVDTTGAGDPRAVDWAARTAAGVILRLAGAGGCRVLLPGDQLATTVTDTTASWRGVHRRLALLGPADPPARRPPLGAGRAPDVHIRAAHAPARVLCQQLWPLPPGVVAVADTRAAP
jgi:uncharacterized protein (DUF58 family)